MDGLKNVQELREQLHKAQEELEEERKRNKGQDSGGEGGGEELEELRRRLDEEIKKMMDLEEQLQKAQVNL
jgi:predicted transcriptional regulator